MGDDWGELGADELRSELLEVTTQRDLLREMNAIMQDHLTPNGKLAFERWKADRAQQIAAELHVKLMEGEA